MTFGRKRISDVTAMLVEGSRKVRIILSISQMTACSRRQRNQRVSPRELRKHVTILEREITALKFEELMQ